MTAAGDRWFAEWFNEDYLRIYAHRNEGEARTAADLIRARVPLGAEGRTLDLGCGAGRHLPFLREQQPTVGFDLSPWLLDVAHRKHPAMPLVRGDMRALPFRDGTFTLVASLFTSFGYFLDEAQHRSVLQDVARVLAPGGWLFLDFLNAPYTRRTVVPFDTRQVGDTWVAQHREISPDGRFISKTIRLEREGRVFTERVRLFEPIELATMLTSCGFAIVDFFGDYGGGALTATSPRAIILAERAEGRR
jgi:SAM-dependent methyltransferase